MIIIMHNFYLSISSKTCDNIDSMQIIGAKNVVFEKNREKWTSEEIKPESIYPDQIITGCFTNESILLTNHELSTVE